MSTIQLYFQYLLMIDVYIFGIGLAVAPAYATVAMFIIAFRKRSWIYFALACICGFLTYILTLLSYVLLCVRDTN